MHQKRQTTAIGRFVEENGAMTFFIGFALATHTTVLKNWINHHSYEKAKSLVEDIRVLVHRNMKLPVGNCFCKECTDSIEITNETKEFNFSNN
jgi:hypothetical protein